MVITYFGEQFVKITQGDFTLAINPVSKSAKGGARAKFGSSVALLSTHHPSMSGIAEVTYGENAPFVVDGPGEYEVAGIPVVGVGSKTEIDGAPYINTSYAFTLDDMSVVVLGAVESEKEIDTIREKAGGVDILFVPVAGTLTPAVAAKVAVSLEPKIVIPLMHEGKGDKNLAQFLKESESNEEMDKLTIKKKDVASRDGDVIVLLPQA